MEKIIVVGSGLAGLSAAITAAKNGTKVQLVSMLKPERSQSVMAEGGINGAINTKGENDTTTEHFNDTLAGGVFLANPNAVKNLTDAAPDVIHWLAKLGVVFNRNEDGTLDARNFGGQKKKRTAFAKSGTGKQIVTALAHELDKYEAAGLIENFTQHRFMQIIKNDHGDCVGCIAQDSFTGEFMPLLADAVIIASGGFHGVFGRTSGSVRNDGAVTAKLFTDGVELANLEFVQYHPTTGSNCGKSMLVTEATRGEGGRLFAWNGDKKWFFMEEKYPVLKNLMPRDVVAREIWHVMNDPENPRQVFLDLTHLPNELIENKLADTLEDCLKYFKLDPREEYIPVTPGIHYFMGGIKVDENHRTNINGLYAAGECCCQYHGANRLGGNSLLGAVFGGVKAAESAISGKGMVSTSTDADKALHELRNKLDDIRSREKSYSYPMNIFWTSKLLYASLGIVRNEEGLATGLSKLEELIDGSVKDAYDGTSSPYENYVFHDQLILAKAIFMSALARKESRGAHYRSDFLQRNDEEFQKTTVISYENEQVSISYEDIPVLRG